MDTRLLTPALLASLALAGCVGMPAESGVDDAPAGATPFRVVSGDYSFSAPSTVEAGLLEVTLENTGREPHHVVFYRLDPGRTLEELRAALIEGKSATPAFATAYGGPNVALPGAPTTAFVRLDAGEYVIACVIPTPADHKMHVEKGMLAPLTVLPSDEPSADPPAPDVTVRLKDFGFDGSAPLVAGEQVVRIVNDGPLVHELVLFELFGNATTMEFIQAMDDPNATAPPPGRPVGGTTPMAPGKEVTVPLSLTPGRYTFVCFDVSGTPHGEPHFLVGMVHEFTVA